MMNKQQIRSLEKALARARHSFVANAAAFLKTDNAGNSLNGLERKYAGKALHWRRKFQRIQGALNSADA